MAYTIGQFQTLNDSASFIVTQHSRKRFVERGIRLRDVRCAIDSGQIVEDYPDNFPYPSCLILGYSNGRPIHVCASIHDNMIYVITAYIPDPQKWKSDWKTRKEDAR